MKKLAVTLVSAIVIFFAANAVSLQDFDKHKCEIHSKHFIFGCPAGGAESNDLIIRDIYAMSSNDDTKFADWVAYRVDKSTIGSGKKRNWKADPVLDDIETLEPDDYKGANAALKTDRGHQAPLATLSGTDSWYEANYLSNITPQKSNLNQGVWKHLEEKVRDLTEEYDYIWVITGPLYEREMPKLPGADEEHRIPSGYFKIISIIENKKMKSAAFIFDQETERNVKILNHLVSIDEVESRSSFDFFHELNNKMEDNIESVLNKAWAEKYFMN